jgi:hypothetical protein
MLGSCQVFINHIMKGVCPQVATDGALMSSLPPEALKLSGGSPYIGTERPSRAEAQRMK